MSFRSRLAIASPKRATSASRSRRWQTTTKYSTVPRLLSSCSARSSRPASRGSKPGDRRCSAVASELGEAPQLGARGDALPLYERSRAPDKELRDLAGGRLPARAGREQDAHDAAVGRVERGGHPVRGPSAARASASSSSPAAGPLLGTSRASGISVPRGTPSPRASTTRHLPSSQSTCPSTRPPPGAALRAGRDRRRGIGKAAETARCEAGQGVENLRDMVPPGFIGQRGYSKRAGTSQPVEPRPAERARPSRRQDAADHPGPPLTWTTRSPPVP